MPLPPDSPRATAGIDPRVLIGGAVVLLVLAYVGYKRYQSNQATAASTAATGANSLNVNANIAPVSSLDQYPQDQLTPMGSLNMPGMNTTDINNSLMQAGQAQQAVTNQ